MGGAACERKPASAEQPTNPRTHNPRFLRLNLSIIRFAGNVAKFREELEAGAFLAATGAKVIVEASRTDTIWGIGLVVADEAAAHPARWRE